VWLRIQLIHSVYLKIRLHILTFKAAGRDGLSNFR
jgi:hypothetical protein